MDRPLDRHTVAEEVASDEAFATPVDSASPAGSAAPVGSATPVSRATPSRRTGLLALRVAFTAAVLAAVTVATVRQWGAVRETILGLAWPAVLASLVLVLLGLGAQTLAFRTALTDLGHPVGVGSAGTIYLVGLLGKYLPGSVWNFVMQMELGRRAGIPRVRALLAPLVCLALSTTAAVVLGVFGLPAVLRAGGVATAGALLLVPAALVCAHPRVLTWLVARFLALTRRPPLAAPISWAGVLAILGWSAVAWVCFGVHLWLLAGPRLVPGAGGVVLCIGAFALALTVGTLAFLSPSGLGVRESILVAALLPYLPAGVALGTALASRLVFTIADLAAAGIAVAVALHVSRRGTSGRA